MKDFQENGGFVQSSRRFNDDRKAAMLAIRETDIATNGIHLHVTEFVGLSGCSAGTWGRVNLSPYFPV
jgi:hypothetical protein